MVYMTFNSSCSYAGVANMLAQYHLTTDDRTIAMNMKLPYLFAYKDGIYMAGPMLQSADWFNLYLNPIGFHMVETTVSAEHVVDYLKRQKTAMLGIKLEQNGKHAVVYMGKQNGQLLFLNNKWKQDPAPEQITFTEAELLKQVEHTITVATLTQIEPIKVDFSGRLRESVSVIRQNLAEIQEVSHKEETVSILHSKLNTLFRPLLLDGITMLRLLGETELAQKFTAIQKSFLTALQQDVHTVITLGDYLSTTELSIAAEGYIQLIMRELSKSTPDN